MQLNLSGKPISMKIGIDAKWYFEGPPSGKRVIKNLVDQILDRDDGVKYYIILDKKHRNREFNTNGNKNIVVCYAWAGNNFLSNVFVLPILSRKKRLDALLYQNFISPFDPSLKIAYIHDVLFLSNPEYYTVFERLYFAPLKFLTKRSDLIVTVSEEEKKRLLNFHFSSDASKIIVAHHGVESGFQSRELYPPSVLEEVKIKFRLPDIFLLYVGRLNLRKNVDNLLRAIPLLENKEIKLVIVGADDWKKSNHVQIINDLGIEGRIYFLGAVYKELGMIYSLATIFCFPSYAESFGLPPLEAMASGVPIVVSNTTSLPEVCGDAGTYITPNRPDEISKSIDKLLTDNSYFDQQRLRGLARAKLFTWEKATSEIIDGIKKIITSNP